MAKTKKKKSPSTTSATHETTVEPTVETTSEPIVETTKVHLEFYGSDVLRQKAPQAFDLAEAVAEEWIKDGNFQKLPLTSPLAQLVAAVGLQSAKRVEKKLEEKGVISIAKMGLEFAKTKWPFKDQKNESI